MKSLKVLFAFVSCLSLSAPQIAQAENNAPNRELQLEVTPLSGLEVQAESERFQLALEQRNRDRSIEPLENGEENDEDSVLGIVDEIWAIGEKIVEVIKAGEPTLNVEKQSWSVLPKGVSQPELLSEWKGPAQQGYRLTLKNLYGITVVEVRFISNAVYAGRYEGKGAYLTHLTVIPTYVDVKWGFNVDMTLEALEPLNFGTPEEPIAGFSFAVQILTSSLMSENLNTVNFYAKGTGEVEAAL
jgi:hypothetical protein